MAVKQSGMCWRDYQRKRSLGSLFGQAERSVLRSMYDNAPGPYLVKVNAQADQPPLLSIPEASMTSLKEEFSSELSANTPSTANTSPSVVVVKAEEPAIKSSADTPSTKDDPKLDEVDYNEADSATGNPNE